jgi:hypothetical protein
MSTPTEAPREQGEPIEEHRGMPRGYAVRAVADSGWHGCSFDGGWRCRYDTREEVERAAWSHAVGNSYDLRMQAVDALLERSRAEAREAAVAADVERLEVELDCEEAHSVDACGTCLACERLAHSWSRKEVRTLRTTLAASEAREAELRGEVDRLRGMVADATKVDMSLRTRLAASEAAREKAERELERLRGGGVR